MSYSKRKSFFYVWEMEGGYWNCQVGRVRSVATATTFSSVREATDARVMEGDLCGVDTEGWVLYAVDRVETWKQVKLPSDGTASPHS